MPESSIKTPHSENQFADYRNFWWNKGFIDLMAKRIKLSKHTSLLDVGCGQCHWSKILTPYLGKPAYVVGVDKDPTWAKGSAELKRFFKEQAAWFELCQGDAMNLPFEDASFDIVTCQTVLIHVGNPTKAIEEMKRVLKPGGTILCVEPNNRIQSLLRTSESENTSIDEMVDHVKYALIVEQGKKRLGFGDNSLGDLLPGMLSKQGFEKIDVRLSDKAIVMVPPYDTQEQMATAKHWKKGNAGDVMNNSDLFYFEAFGDRYLSFYDEYHQKYEGHAERIFEALKNNDFHSAGGALMYLVSGKKPGH
jgi:ubiquinone/menaquinone biosynthesis C-methylase UbiE